jgi:putative membrane protein
MSVRTIFASRSLLFLALAGASGSILAAAAEDTAPAADVFVTKAAQDGMTEVELGKLALDKSQNAEVRSFAQRMVTDHGKANRELAALAKTKGIDAPKSLDAEHQAVVADFKAKDGAAFDTDYSSHMSMDHSKAISLFEAESKADDPDLSKFAKNTLPTLKEHKKLASKLPGQ